MTGALFFTTALVEAFCPCYTLSSNYNTYSCGVEAVAGTNPTVAEWTDIFALVSRGPSGWGSAGPSARNLTQGCGNPEPARQVPARFPCELLQAIAMVESDWRQFCVPDRPADQVGNPSRTIISFDCGYGVAQVTSGMHQGETPGYDRQRVAAEPTYNLATGARLLADKWAATRCVGDRQPERLEHWYSAVWAYNGLAYLNNPNNPVYSSSRGVYHPAVGGSAPYQEKVFGQVEHPPSPSHWTSVPLAYPNPAEIGGGNAPAALAEPRCASPTDCATSRTVHLSICLQESDGGTDAGPVADSGTPDAGADAGADAGPPEDAGPPPPPDPVILPALGEEVELGKPEGCGCQVEGAAALALLALLCLLRARR